ncbi:hypothetical protein AABH71_002084 [Salmonella enterica]|uniref:hypothetical protein n=1 Tax=Salmonella enterica TaxID=28901 RepID=UPI0012D4F0AA|nr:hypothetical protein [Salmonella enterica]EBQ9001285.1 hypothetical protein [Salmonella enterica subsp. enterica serovar Blockley]ECU7993225.1 hypothetical protein [Salmonella enterica subsp. enterica serovar Toucra]ECW2125354.1 hypothetical protein [Salmonella enterica]
MKIAFEDYGNEASVIITSTVFEFRKHKRAVNKVLSVVPKAFRTESSAFVLKTHIYGNAADLYQAYLFVKKEMKL